jgi:hypothetical protein
MAVMTMVAAALAALLFAFAAWGHVSRKTRLIGVLMPTAALWVCRPEALESCLRDTFRKDSKSKPATFS